MKKTYIKTASLLSIVFFSLFSASVLAWDSPTVSPFGDNVPKPFNVGAEVQTKQGSIGVGVSSIDSNYRLTISGGGVKVESAGQPAGYFSSSLGYGLLVNQGNVGIGTITPSTKLDVSGTIKTTGFQLTTGAVSGYVLTSNALGVGSWQNILTLPLGALGQTLRYNGIDWVADSLIYNNGTNIGIGTTNPEAKLEIAGQIKILEGNPGSGKILTSDEDGLASWQTPSATYWTLSGTNLYPTLTDYNIGAGTTSLDSNYKITTINGGIKAETNIAGQPAGYFNSTNGGAGIKVETNDGGYVCVGGICPVFNSTFQVSTITRAASILLSSRDNEMGIYFGADSHALYRPNGLNQFRFWIGNDLMSIGTKVGVGSGNTNPSANLDVKGATSLPPGSGSATDAILRLQVGSQSATVLDFGVLDNGLSAWMQVADSANLGNTQNLAIQPTGGNVGIGTITPSTKLDVSGTIKTTGFQLTTGAVSGYVLTSDASGLANWQVSSGSFPSGISGQTIRNDGSNWIANSVIYNDGTNVGIGTTTPGAKLEINGGIKINTISAKPTCNASARGVVWFTQGASGVKDSLEVCAKNASNVYAWRLLY